MEQIFIDRFNVPATAQNEFKERMAINRKLLKQLPGFIRDEVYEREGEDASLICITIAVWASQTDLQQAKEFVQAEYQRQGFDLPEMLERLQIRMERGQYRLFSGK